QPSLSVRPLVKLRQRHHGELGLAERRAEIFIRLLRIEPPAPFLLAFEQEPERLRDLRLLGRVTGAGERVEAVIGLKLDRRAVFFKQHGPLAVVALQREDALGVALDAVGVCGAVNLNEGDRLVAEVDVVLDLLLFDQPSNQIAIFAAFVLAGQPEHFVEDPPTVPGDFIRTDQRRVAVALVVRQFGPALVVDLQIARDSFEQREPLFAGEFAVVLIDESRKAAQHVGRRADDARPVGVLVAVERERVVGQSFGQELERRAFVDRVSVLFGRQFAARREVRGVAGDAELRLEMNARNAIDYAAVTRRVGVPTVARADQIIHSGADGLAGRIFLPTVLATALIAERRRVVNRRAQLIEDVIGVDSNVVRPAIDDPRGELVAGQGLDFVRRRNRVGAAFVTLRFAVFDGEDRNVDRDVVALE